MIEGTPIHETLRAMVQRIYDETHIRVDRVTFDWMDLSSGEGPKQVVVKVYAETMASAP